ncbi:Phosphoglycolate phosphatase [Thermodesulfovibrio sp. N1]|uniref:HAD-IA family hydrolase n=1 Tax=Thermodesulfovibrio sp. N1 TaxID=1871110 RepID=UPI00083A02B6|nr:HAD-IA family hydrolase [Thermodesulfovibrio sp. N1]ODA43283.1 Phosphoglycolate phosphatase [Thermodesulfovibrio sp. N1]
MTIELIIFDLDGTLVDSCEDIKNALNYCLKLRGLEGFSQDEVRKMVGEGVKRLIEQAIEKRGAKKDLLEELLNCFVSYYSNNIAVYTKPYPEVSDILDKLYDIKKAVISNKLSFLTIKTLEKLNLLHYFDFVAGSDTFSQQKPSPVPILETMKKFNVSQENTLIVGDSNIDIETGKSAGIKTVAVTYGYRERELLKDADFIIDRFSDLLSIVRKT